MQVSVLQRSFEGAMMDYKLITNQEIPAVVKKKKKKISIVLSCTSSNISFQWNETVLLQSVLGNPLQERYG